jgi:hypothetical protein
VFGVLNGYLMGFICKSENDLEVLWFLVFNFLFFSVGNADCCNFFRRY